ncbi:MAG: SPFH domain-containing protein [Planctomycetota bacterium]|nr:SPFH domain-containing protein [Planctomycetota bacterium]
MASSDDFEKAFAENDPPGEGSRPSRGPGGNKSAILVLAFLLVLLCVVVFASGHGGIIEVEADQVAVVADYLTGESEVHLEPGYQFFIPFLQRGFLFDKSVQEFVMEGDVDRDSNHVKKLTVRANDGSNLWFDKTQLQYRVIPSMADVVLADSGLGDNFKNNWVRAYARSILRDEFGKFSSSAIADPTNYNIAAAEARDRLNRVLHEHGLDIIQIITPKPKFDQRYEAAIEDRKVANQEVERLRARAEQLRRERERRIAEINSSKAVAFEFLKGSLNAEFIEAQRDQVRIERSADAYKTRMVGEGNASKATLIEQARGMREKALKEAEGLRAKTDALAKQGEVLVRERLAERLKDIEFSLVPYTKDAQPTRIELEGLSGSENLGGGR